MGKILKILKVNLLSIIALPLLLLATVCKLIAKAMEKAALVVSLMVVTILLVMGFEFFKNPDGGMNVIAAIIVAFIVAGLIILIFILLMRFAASVIAAIWMTITAFFEAIYSVTYSGFLKLFEICENDYLFISLDGKTGLNAVLCLFFTILRAVNKVIVTVISLALFASIALSILVVGGTLIGLSSDFQKTFGLNLFEAMGRYDTFSLVYGIVMLIAILAIIVSVLLSLGIEWHEWAMELKLTGEELTENIKSLQRAELSVESGSGSADSGSEEAASEVGTYMEKLIDHQRGIDSLAKQVESLLSSGDGGLLRNTWVNYLHNLTDITDEFSEHKNGIPLNRFKQLIPRIEQLDRQRLEVTGLAEKLQKELEDPIKSSVFFVGCSSAEKLEKRYKSLCKAYHPDTEGGDMETFRKMQEEYERLKGMYTSRKGNTT